jgi:UDP-N-acetylmuramoylalanine--D-glutamate ligase
MIFARQQAGDIAIAGIDDPAARALYDSLPGAISISGSAPADIWADGALLQDKFGPIVDLSQAAALPGPHNAQNAAAAAALALSLGVPREDVARGIRSFAGLAHRQELVGEIDGVRFINDSKATNADATARALACYDPVVWIAGGIAKAGGIAPLAPYFPRIAKALLIGRDAPQFAAELARHKLAHDVVETLDRAVPAALRAARGSGASVVLLSPACASFDQFSGFEARGARFRELVGLLADAPAKMAVV